jgi:hypothetical protein
VIGVLDNKYDLFSNSEMLDEHELENVSLSLQKSHELMQEEQLLTSFESGCGCEVVEERRRDGSKSPFEIDMSNCLLRNDGCALISCVSSSKRSINFVFAFCDELFIIELA